MKKETKACVILPDRYDQTNDSFPVLYFLHGYSTNCFLFADYLMEKKCADQFGFIIVCPDGNFSSWYIDSPVDSSSKYETYTALEVPEFIDKNYRTINERRGRAISGISMGGYGALYLAIKHQDIFSAAGSLSGAVDFRTVAPGYDIPKRFGDKDRYSVFWDNNVIINMLMMIETEKLSIIFDCGTEDFLIEENRNLHEAMLKAKILHEYIESPGEHNLKYWDHAIKEQLFYFHNFFISMNAK
jgi:S-formylglutathione hydrolase FrmB